MAKQECHAQAKHSSYAGAVSHSPHIVCRIRIRDYFDVSSRLILLCILLVVVVAVQAVRTGTLVRSICNILIRSVARFGWPVAGAAFNHAEPATPVTGGTHFLEEAIVVRMY